MPHQRLLISAETLCRCQWRLLPRSDRPLSRQYLSKASSHTSPAQPLSRAPQRSSPPPRSSYIHPRPTACPFSTTITRSKKAKNKDEPKSTRIRGHSPNETTIFDPKSSTDVAENDPFNFTDLHAGIAKAVERLQDALSKLRAGGRFNPETIETLKVPLKTGLPAREGTKVPTQMVNVGDLAQVVPRGGRMVVVLVGEEEVRKNKRPSTAPFSTPSPCLSPRLKTC